MKRSNRMVAVMSVNRRKAGAVRFAQTTGNVSLILRAPGDATARVAATTGIVRELVRRWGILPPAPVSL